MKEPKEKQTTTDPGSKSRKPSRVSQVNKSIHSIPYHQSNINESSRNASPAQVFLDNEKNDVNKNNKIHTYPKLCFVKEYLLKPNPRTLSVALIIFCTSLVYIISHL